MAGIEFDDLWNYDNPAATETTFRGLLKASSGKFDLDWELELQTQIARTLGLQHKFTEAHALLDSIEKQAALSTPRVHVRYLLERGRVYNSNKNPDTAKVLFRAAYDLASEKQQLLYAIDAAHMLAIVSDPAEAKSWNELAISIAEQSEDKRCRKWLGSLYNNLGWAYFGEKRYDSALIVFEKAVKERRAQGKAKELRIARWCLARTMRATNEIDAALKMQMELLAEQETANDPDGYIYEEIAECLVALKREKEATPYFAKAYELLSTDKWLQRDEPDRLKRLKELGKVK